MKSFGRVLGAGLLGAWLLGALACGGSGGEGTVDGANTGGDTAVAGDSSGPLADGQNPTNDALVGPDGAGGPDVPPVTGPCLFNDDCNPPATRCEEGQCVGGCPGNPCPGGWVCSTDSGTCYKECLRPDDCTQEGFYCGGTRCEAGCPWKGCPFLDDICDPVSGICAPEWCRTDWELNGDPTSITLLHEELAQGQYAMFRLNVKPQKPTPAQIDVALDERSDDEVQILDVGYFTGPDTFVSVMDQLPYDAAPGMQLVVAVGVAAQDITGYYGEVEITTDPFTLMCSENPLRLIIPGTTSCVSFQPQELRVGPVAWGDVSTETVRLRNDCAYDVSVVKMDLVSTMADWSVAGDYEGQVLSASGGTLDVSLFFWPTIPGNRNTKLLVITDDHDNRVIEVPLWGRAVQ